MCKMQVCCEQWGLSKSRAVLRLMCLLEFCPCSAFRAVCHVFGYILALRFCKFCVGFVLALYFRGKMPCSTCFPVFCLLLLVGFLCVFPCSLSVPCSFTVGSFWQLFQWELRLFRGNPVLGLLGSSFLGFINGVSVRCDNPLLCVGWVLPFVASGRLLIFFCWVFGKNFGDSVGMLSWVCCALGFGVQMGWFRVRW